MPVGGIMVTEHRFREEQKAHKAERDRIRRAVNSTATHTLDVQETLMRETTVTVDALELAIIKGPHCAAKDDCIDLVQKRTKWLPQRLQFVGATVMFKDEELWADG